MLRRTAIDGRRVARVNVAHDQFDPAILHLATMNSTMVCAYIYSVVPARSDNTSANKCSTFHDTFTAEQICTVSKPLSCTSQASFLPTHSPGSPLNGVWQSCYIRYITLIHARVSRKFVLDVLLLLIGTFAYSCFEYYLP